MFEYYNQDFIDLRRKIVAGPFQFLVRHDRERSGGATPAHTFALHASWRLRQFICVELRLDYDPETSCQIAELEFGFSGIRRLQRYLDYERERLRERDEQRAREAEFMESRGGPPV